MISSILPESLRNKLTSSPALARSVPFIVFVVLTFLQDQFGEPGRYWIYFLKTIAGAWLLWQVRFVVAEMKWAFSIEAVLVGVGVFIIWVGADSLPFSHLSRKGLAWNPFAQFDYSPAHAWFFVAVRIVGSSIVVPPLEEIFYRSFLYRWIVKPDFQSVPFNLLNHKALFGTALIFGFAHHEWLAGILCGLVYQWLVLRKNRLGDAMTAHAITNFLLGVWVVWKEAWQFW